MLNLFILAFIVGLISGITTFIFGTGLNFIIKFLTVAFPYNLLLLPLVGFLTVKARNKYSKEVSGSMEQIFKGTKSDKELSPIIIPFQFITTWFAHLAGASVGREGVAVQMGATIGNKCASYVPTVSRAKFTRLGMAAGFAGLFGTPLAATVFSFEVTRSRKLDYPYIGATFFASIVAYFISSTLGLDHFHVDTKFQSLDIRQMIFFIFCVVVFVSVGHLFARSLKLAKAYNSKIKLNESYKIILLSVIGAVLLFLLFDGRYMSLGTNIINDAFNQPENIKAADFILKIGFTAYFVGIGFSGGEVTPLFAIGSSLGILLASIFSLPLTIVGGIGYAFVFGNATNAYFAAAILAVEVFGLGMIPYALIALVITLFIRNDSHTIYPELEWE